MRAHKGLSHCACSAWHFSHPDCQLATRCVNTIVLACSVRPLHISSAILVFGFIDITSMVCLQASRILQLSSISIWDMQHFTLYAMEVFANFRAVQKERKLQEDERIINIIVCVAESCLILLQLLAVQRRVCIRQWQRDTWNSNKS